MLKTTINAIKAWVEKNFVSKNPANQIAYLGEVGMLNPVHVGDKIITINGKVINL